MENIFILVFLEGSHMARFSVSGRVYETHGLNVFS